MRISWLWQLRKLRNIQQMSQCSKVTGHLSTPTMSRQLRKRTVVSLKWLRRKTKTKWQNLQAMLMLSLKNNLLNRKTQPEWPTLPIKALWIWKILRLTKTKSSKSWTLSHKTFQLCAILKRLKVSKRVKLKTKRMLQKILCHATLKQILLTMS